MLSLVVTTCVVDQFHGYWLLYDVLASTIKLYVQLSKNILKSWAKVDVVKDMDMCTEMKQLGVKMQKQIVIVLRLFHDFITNFMFEKKTHLEKDIFIKNHHYYLQCDKVLETIFLHILNITKFG